jgi:hypothetical protein
MLIYSSIAAVQLMQVRGAPPCDASLVAQQLLGKARGASITVRPSAGLVVLSGVLYEEGQDLYLRSFVRMYRNAPAGDEIVMKVADLALTAPTPVEGVAFPPVHLTAADIATVEKTFRASSLVRKDRNLSTSGYEIPFDPDFPFAFRIVEVAGDWTRIEPISDGPAGWMHNAETNLLRHKMPELRFMVAAVGYLQTASGGQGTRGARASLDELMNQSASLEQSPETLAAVHALSAQVRLQEGRSADHWRRAVTDLDQAIGQAPSDARIKNFTAVCRAWLVYNDAAASKYKPADIAADLKDAAARTSDVRMLRNLSRVYQAMLTLKPFRPGIPEPPSLLGTRDETIREEMQKIDKIIAATPAN